MLTHILQQGARTSVTGPGITPGGVLLYGDQGSDVAAVAFGSSHLEPSDSVFPVSTDTIYDVASLTKPMATAAVLMKLDIDLDEPVQRVVPELDGASRVTFAHLLGHGSGLPAHVRFYERLRAGERAGCAGVREALYRMVLDTGLAAEPGQRAVYSDLGYIVLGLCVERLLGKRLDDVVAELVTGPLRMDSTFFIDLADGSPVVQGRPIVPTEICPYRGLVWGAVHDDNAHAGGGVFGHAGLFSTAGDVARFARALVTAAAGQPVAGFQPEVVRRFWAGAGAPGTTWRLGWDTPAPLPAPSHAGVLWPRHGVGHLGFTGCSLWLDPPRGRYVVLLTNRVHPSRDIVGIREFRGAVMDAVVTELDRMQF